AAKHRLVSAIAYVDDGQTAMTESGAAIAREPGSGSVGTARMHCLPRSRQLIEIHQRCAGAKGDDSVDSAHESAAVSHSGLKPLIKWVKQRSEDQRSGEAEIRGSEIRDQGERGS